MFRKQTIDGIIGTRTELSAEMVEAISLWNNVYTGRAPWLSDDVKSLGIEQGIASELANVCMSELETEISVPLLDDIFKKTLRHMQENLKGGLALGSFAVKPLGSGGICEYVPADRIIPIRYDAMQRLVDVAFLDIRKSHDSGAKETDLYVRIERHKLTPDGTLTISNTVCKTTDGGGTLRKGGDLTLYDDWAGLVPEIVYQGVQRPIFGYYKNPMQNFIDGGSMGVSCFGSALDLIADADKQYGRLIWEMKGGELAVMVSPNALNTEKKGRMQLNSLTRRLYRELAIDTGAHSELFHVFSPTLRDESIINGLNEILRRIEFAVGLSYGDLSDVELTAKTATEVIQSKQRKYQAVKAIEDNLRDCLEDLAYAIAFHERLTTSKYEFACTFHDSIMTDEASENEAMRADVSGGILKPEIYLMRKYGWTEEEARQNMPESPVAAADGHGGAGV